MTLRFVVTLKLKTVIKKSERQLSRSGAGSYSYSNVALAPAVPEFKC